MSDTCPVVRIADTKAPGGFVEINEDDYEANNALKDSDPKKKSYRLWVEPKAGSQLKGKLPDDFPGIAALNAFDPPIHTYAQLRKAMKDDVKIPGIAEGTKAKIVAALAAKPEAEDEG